MARTPIVRGQGASGTKIEVEGLNAFLRDLKKSGQRADDDIRKANEKIAAIVIRKAGNLADTKQEKRAAATLNESSTLTAVRVTGGSASVPYFGGANFGSYTNKKRIIKAPRTTAEGRRRGRSTLVRRGESVTKVVQRIEAQSVDTRGKLVPRGHGNRVQVARLKNGQVKVIRGWNQFRPKGGKSTKWQRGKDQFVYRAVGALQKQIVEEYTHALDTFTHDSFGAPM